MKNKILLIDDDVDFLEATSLLLKANGYEVLNAYNGQEGFQKIKDESPDLILLDMMMTYKTEGAETAKAIASDAAIKDIPMILVTGAKKETGFDYDLKPNTAHLPVKEIIEKPIDPEPFLRTIHDYIRKTGTERREFVNSLASLVNKWKDKQGNLIMILHEIQNTYGYVPRDVSFELSRMLNITLTQIYEVITFYSYFKLDPPGKHLISVCMGTACYLKGAPQLLQTIENILGITEGQTTNDKLFHLQIVRCLGCCGLSPVIMIDDKVYGKVNKEEISNIISQYTKNSAEVLQEN